MSQVLFTHRLKYVFGHCRTAGVILLFLLVVNDDTVSFGERGPAFMSYDCAVILHGVILQRCLVSASTIACLREPSLESPDMERRMKTEFRFRLTHDWMN